MRTLVVLRTTVEPPRKEECREWRYLFKFMQWQTEQAEAEFEPSFLDVLLAVVPLGPGDGISPERGIACESELPRTSSMVMK